MTLLFIVLAVLLDWLLGEPTRRHPLVGFGRLTKLVETRLYSSEHNQKKTVYQWLTCMADTRLTFCLDCLFYESNYRAQCPI